MASAGPSKEASDSKRLAIYLDLLEKFVGEKFAHGDVQFVANKHGVNRRTFQRY